MDGRNGSGKGRGDAHAHQHASGHGHSHVHIHSHAPAKLTAADLTPAFRLSIALNVAYLLFEAAAGFWTGSLALLADAAHNLTDVAGLLLAWGAAVLAGRMATERYTYGFGRATILAALANALAILVGAGAVIWEAVRRFSEPVEVPGGVVLGVALVGIAVNAGSALLFRGHGGDLNARGAYLHLVADAAVSLAVVLAAAGIMATGWQWLDPVVAILVSLLIAYTAWDLLRRATRAAMDAVPDGVDRGEIARFLAARPGVAEVHDLHIWPLSTTETALTAHLVMPEGGADDAFLKALRAELRARHGIDHVTIQTERARDPDCPAH